jgi:hypothetical protein
VAYDETDTSSGTVVDIQIFVRQVLTVNDDALIGSATSSILARDSDRIPLVRNGASKTSALLTTIRSCLEPLDCQDQFAVACPRQNFDTGNPIAFRYRRGISTGRIVEPARPSISVDTYDARRANVMSTLGAKNAAELIQSALKEIRRAVSKKSECVFAPIVTQYESRKTCLQ